MASTDYLPGLSDGPEGKCGDYGHSCSDCSEERIEQTCIICGERYVVPSGVTTNKSGYGMCMDCPWSSCGLEAI